MNQKRHYFHCGLLFLILQFVHFSAEATTQRDFQTWLNFTATGSLSNKESLKRFKFWLEGQERIGDESSRFSQTLLRGALGYSLKKNLSLWLGYAWVYTGVPFTYRPFEENRIWQQLLWVKENDYFTFTSRTRMEQRFLETSHKTAYRARQLVKLVVPLNSLPNVSLVGSDELFWHKNDFIGRNGKGFDQNRVFIGLAYKLNPKFTTEVGYMNQYIRRLGVPNFCSNILGVNFYLNL